MLINKVIKYIEAYSGVQGERRRGGGGFRRALGSVVGIRNSYIIKI